MVPYSGSKISSEFRPFSIDSCVSGYIIIIVFRGRWTFGSEGPKKEEVMTQEKDQKKRAGCGIKKLGLRTSAETKALKRSIQERLRDKHPLNKRQQRKLNAMLRSREGIKAASGKRKVLEVERNGDAARQRGWKQDKSGKWRNGKGHFVKAEKLAELGLK